MIEYGLHRYVFHADISNAVIRRLVNGFHAEHHEMPRDADRLLVRTPYALGVSALLYGPVLILTADWFRAMGALAGIWLGFLYYEAVHYRVHLTIGAAGLIGRQRKAHFHHHFRNPDQCFGVTTPLWDHIFGTKGDKF